MASRLIWYGAQLSARMRLASAAAIRETIDAAAEQASAETWIETGLARDSVQAGSVEPEGSSTLVGRFGSKLWRFWFIEAGVEGRPGGHFLRRAADTEYPDLIGRIRRRFA